MSLIVSTCVSVALKRSSRLCVMLSLPNKQVRACHVPSLYKPMFKSPRTVCCWCRISPRVMLGVQLFLTKPSQYLEIVDATLLCRNFSTQQRYFPSMGETDADRLSLPHLHNHP